MSMSRDSLPCAAAFLTCILLHRNILTELTFFGDEIDSLRTFEVETQLSKEKKDSICIVPELSGTEGADICFLDFLG